MIDTIAVAFNTELSEEDLRSWQRKRTDESPSFRREKRWINKEVDGAIVKGTYYFPNSDFPKPRLTVEASLPIVLYGSNSVQFSEIAEVHAAALVLNDLIDGIPGMPDLDVREGELVRIDVCANHFVGEMVPEYVKALFDLNYPHRKTGPYPHQGVQFNSQIISTKFYSKAVKSGAVEDYGKLRHETTIRKNYYIGRLMNINTPTLWNVTPEFAASVLKDDLARLHLDRQLICPRHEAQDMLRQTHGRLKGNRLYGFLIELQTMGRDKLKEIGYTDGNIRRNIKLIADAGVALTTTNAEIALPPLRIEWM